jgi:hypothetical protein
MKHQDKANFDSEWRKACSIRACSIADIRSFIRAHYLHKPPAVITLALAMMHGCKPVGGVVFALPPQATAKRYGGVTWELARLYIIDDIPRNGETWLISQAIKFIRRYHSIVEFLVSYADPSVGHHGTIYKAANWRSDGRTDQERKSPRCDYVADVDMINGVRFGRRAHIAAGAEIKRVPRVSKYRFVYPLRAAE